MNLAVASIQNLRFAYPENINAGRRLAVGENRFIFGEFFVKRDRPEGILRGGRKSAEQIAREKRDFGKLPGKILLFDKHLAWSFPLRHFHALTFGAAKLGRASQQKVINVTNRKRNRNCLKLNR